MVKGICLSLAILSSLPVSLTSEAMDSGALTNRTQVESKSGTWKDLAIAVPFLVGAAAVAASWCDARNATNDAYDKLKKFENKYGDIAEVEHFKHKLENAKRLKMDDQWLLAVPPLAGLFSKDPNLVFAGVSLSGFSLACFS